MIYSIHLKRLLVSLILFCGLLLSVYSYIEHQHSKEKELRFLQVSQQASQLVDTLILAKKEKVVLIALSLAHESALQEALDQGELSNVNFQNYIKDVAKYVSLKNIGIQIIDKKGLSLYRSWTDKRGDAIIEKRQDLQALYQAPRIMQSISAGVFDLTFKSMVPIYRNKQFIGVFEVLAKFNSIAEKLNKDGLETVILVDESYKDQLKNPFTKRFLGQNYIANLNAKEEQAQVISNHGLKRLANKEPYSILPDRNSFVSYKTIYGADNQSLATFFLFQPLQPIIDSVYKPSIQVYLYLIAIYLFIVIVYLWRRAYLASKKATNFNQALRSEVKYKDQALQHQAYFWQNIIDGLDDTIVVIDKNYDVSLKNKAAQSSSSSDEDIFCTDKKCHETIFNSDNSCKKNQRACPLKKCFATGKAATVVQEIITEDGQQRYLEFTATPLRDEHGNVDKVIEIGHDITPYLQAKNQLEEQKKELDFMAYHDALTQLPNRVLFLDRLQQALDHAKRSKRIVGVLFIDLDRFKEINDTFGHKMGDMVLIECAKRLKSVVRISDTVSRLGGDEFTVIIDEISNSTDVVDIVQKLLKVIAVPISVEDHKFYLTTSVGISMAPTDGDTIHDLMKNADTAMYQAKDAGRNSYAFYNPEMTQTALKRVQLEEKLRIAIDERQFVLHYQPQYDINSGSISGFEALVRWIHPEDGMISPAEFIPLAEDTGMITSIGQQVMFDAMLAIRNWHNAGLTDKRVAINVSAKQFQDESLLEMVQETLMATSCQPEWVELEITESSVMTNNDYTVSVLEELQKMGITISIDDFGTGYSSLAELKRMPINKLKIDQSFVRNLPASREDAEITRAIISMAKSLDLDLIAEGIETFEQSAFMLGNGCHKAQGYLYSRPIPEDEIISMLKAIKAR